MVSGESYHGNAIKSQGKDGTRRISDCERKLPCNFRSPRKNRIFSDARRMYACTISVRLFLSRRTVNEFGGNSVPDLLCRHWSVRTITGYAVERGYKRSGSKSLKAVALRRLKNERIYWMRLKFLQNDDETIGFVLNFVSSGRGRIDNWQAQQERSAGQMRTIRRSALQMLKYESLSLLEYVSGTAACKNVYRVGPKHITHTYGRHAYFIMKYSKFVE